MGEMEPLNLKLIRDVLRRIKKQIVRRKEFAASLRKNHSDAIHQESLRQLRGERLSIDQSLCEMDFEFAKLISPTDRESRNGTGIAAGDSSRIRAAPFGDNIIKHLSAVQHAIPAAVAFGSDLESQDSAIAAIDDFLETGGGAPKPRVKHKEIDERARRALKGKPPRGKRRWTERDLAKAIGCSAAAVHQSAVFRAYFQKYDKPESRLSKKPKTIALTDKILAMTGKEDEELKRLRIEQEKDHKDDLRRAKRAKGEKL